MAMERPFSRNPFSPGQSGGVNLNDFFAGQQERELERQRLSNERLALSSRQPQAFTAPATQGYLPPYLQDINLGPTLERGIGQIGELIARPGGLGSGVSEAIAPRLAAESQTIAQNFRNISSEQAGAAARGNVPVSLKGAIQAAILNSQERAQRGARGEAIAESEQLRRQDVQGTLQLLNTILQFVQSGRGQSIAGQQIDVQRDAASNQKKAANLAAIATLIGAFASASRFKEDFVPITSESVLSAVRALPVYRWRYKGDTARHIGPMAEDFREAFGLGDSPDYIHVVDAVGTLMAATQALAHKVDRLEAR